jgi:dTDP-4-amino-4,6-dideoxygalactose transaminase
MDVSLNPANLESNDREKVEEVLKSGNIKGGGKFDEKAADLIKAEFGAENVLMTTSCTHSLEMAALLLELQDGDEVIMPSYTFSSTATAFMLRGAKPVFADIKPDTLNIDPDSIRNKITENTEAIVPVHYAGLGCEMDEIMAIAEENDLKVVEDAAQAVNAKYRDEYLGTIGDIGCYSFHETKSFVGGEGGATLMDDEYIERAEMLRQKGTNYVQFKRGEVEKYTWNDLGSSWVPSEMQTALIYSQLQKADRIVKEREQNFRKYLSELEELREEGKLRLPKIPENRSSNYHIFHIRTNSEELRDKLGEELRENGVEAYSHYEPLHLSKMGGELGYSEGELPVTEESARTILRLPVHRKVSEKQITKIADIIKQFYADR